MTLNLLANSMTMGASTMMLASAQAEPVLELVASPAEDMVPSLPEQTTALATLPSVNAQAQTIAGRIQDSSFVDHLREELDGVPYFGAGAMVSYGKAAAVSLGFFGVSAGSGVGLLYLMDFLFAGEATMLGGALFHFFGVGLMATSIISMGNLVAVAGGGFVDRYRFNRFIKSLPARLADVSTEQRMMIAKMCEVTAQDASINQIDVIAEQMKASSSEQRRDLMKKLVEDYSWATVQVTLLLDQLRTDFSEDSEFIEGCLRELSRKGSAQTLIGNSCQPEAGEEMKNAAHILSVYLSTEHLGLTGDAYR